MTDREVIKGMEQFREDLKPFCGNHADWERFDAGFALLKEQEAVKPEFFKNEWRCGVCSHVVLTYCFDPNEGHMGKVMSNYCPSCGRQVKWE